MKPIAYVGGLNQQYQSEGFPPYRWSEFDFSPWTPLKKPLSQSCITLISSAGIYVEDQHPFDPWAVNDSSFRLIPVETPWEKLKLAHNYYDHRDALKDLNCVFPVDRLTEFEKEGVIGRLAPVAITLGMGRMFKRTELRKQTVPQIIEVLKKAQTDAAFLVAC